MYRSCIKRLPREEARVSASLPGNTVGTLHPEKVALRGFRTWVRFPPPPPKKKKSRKALFCFWRRNRKGIESPAHRVAEQKHSGGVFLGRSAAVTGNMRNRNDRERQNAFWRNRRIIVCPTASTTQCVQNNMHTEKTQVSLRFFLVFAFDNIIQLLQSIA